MQNNMQDIHAHGEVGFPTSLPAFHLKPKRRYSTMKKDNHITKVIFRKFKDGDVVAIFPELAGDISTGTSLSYMQMGQHGICTPLHLINTTTPALPSEFAALKRELAGLGYNLLVVHRSTYKHFVARKDAIAA